jgi:hypothetical protein|tara:strand:+ start:533 stop:691 length:159 start_codon:yes stop_codon:yes gene_type:complete
MDKIKKVINAPIFQACVAGGAGLALLMQNNLLYAGMAFGIGIVKFIGAFKSL